ncbi:MAG: hypothetical protein QOF78_3580 [Phycisphaerales bacterium]|jgi:hypothetical protein|nr:hypothetical protein [Phycisphaerales bacterium]
MSENPYSFPDLRAAAGAADTAEDRRRYPRATHRVVFNLRPLLNDGVGAPIAVVLQDFSILGMGIIHSTAMRRGDQFQIPLMRDGDICSGDDGDSGRLSLVATVVRCEQLDDGLFNIGFEFNSSVAAVDEGSRQLTGQPAPRD